MLKIIFLIYLYFVFVLLAHNLNDEFLLCKHCGYEIAYIKHIFYKKSPQALKAWNDTKFIVYNHTDRSHSATTIQMLVNPLGNHFELITVTEANLSLVNNTKSIKDTWFPNFTWTIGLCPQCMGHIGWYFESIFGETNCFCLIVDKLLDESYADSIILKPNFKMY